MQRIPFRAFLMLLVLSAPVAMSAPPRTDAQVSADEQYADGNYATAAEAYLQAASMVPATDRNPLLIRAAEAALRADRSDLASQALHRIDLAQLTTAQKLRVDLAQASLGKLSGGPRDWLERLPPPGREADPDLAERLLSVRADAYLRLGDVTEAVHALVLREDWLRDSETRARNQARIWSAIQTAPAIGTRFQGRSDLDSTTRGWLELGLLQRVTWTDPDERNDNLNAWERRYRDHPATDTVLDLVRSEPSILSAARNFPHDSGPRESPDPVAALTMLPPFGQSPAQGPVRTIALILPLSGPLSGAARAVRDGFLTAWFEQPVPRPRVLVFDNGVSDSALAVYERALAAGADMVVGPLSKEAVSSLARMVAPARPLLALNYLDSHQPAPANFYQFGLAPEDEAEQVADRALADGHRRAVALVPEGDWGSRTLTAFRQRFENQGGKLLDAEFYASGLQDFSTPVQRLLKLEDSSLRQRALGAVLGDAIEFSASPGALPDFVFMAAQPEQGRLIRPQFRFQGAGQIPLYATSLIYEGTAAPGRDADLDDIRFCDMPFLLGSGDRASARNRIRSLWPDTFARHMRLYAFGYDAAQLSQRLAGDGSRTHSGVTGQLRVGENGRVHRDLLWARFENGRPQPLSESRSPP